MMKFSLIFLVFCFYSYANIMQVEADAKAFGKQMSEKNKNNVYRAEDIPGFQTANPKEVEYYKDASKLNLDIEELSEKNEDVKMIIKVDSEKSKFESETSALKNNIKTSEIPKDLYCIDGKCAQEYQNEKADPNRMKDSLTALNIIQEIQKDASKDNKNLKIFKGEVLSCTKDRVGYNDCCKSDGWGKGIGANCSPSEQNLGLKREKKQCIYVRTYCSKSSIFGCIVDTREYCCFDSNLSKIIAENGRKQLNISWRPIRIEKKWHCTGSDNHGNQNCRYVDVYIPYTDCRGFTPDELSRIKMDNIDFTEFTRTLNPKINNIDKDTMQNQINKSIKRGYEN